MQSKWQIFLSQHGGNFNEQGQIEFSNSPREEISQLDSGCHLATLDHLGVIHVAGEDAQSFLQGQFSNDITLLDSTSSQISAYCNPKGRMLAQLLIIQTAGEYYLLLPRTILEKTLMRLRMFVLRSKVTLTDLSDEMVCLGLIGAQAGDTDIPLPASDYDVASTDQIFIAKIPASPDRYLVLTPLDKATSLWQSLSDKYPTVSSQAWHWLDIKAGLPNIQTETVEEFVPQMLNLELIGGVNFKKGCYPGQEIVARMHYLGKPKRRMFRLHTKDEGLPLPGEDIYLADGDGQSAGKVVMAQPAESEGTDLLAVIRLNHADSTELRLGSVSGSPLSFESLPYSLDTN